MKFFLDTANLNQIKNLNELGLVDGVTTNPSLMAKEGITGNKAVMKHYAAICAEVQGPVSAEVLSTDYGKMLEEADALKSIAPNIVVKIPMIQEGIRAIKTLSGTGVNTNCTLVFSPTQALLAAKAGATYVSPFVGRLDDISTDGMQLIEDIRIIFDNYEFKTEILAASLRHPIHVLECAKIGADVITAPADVLMKLFNHTLTDKGLKQFIEDSKNLV